MFGFLNLRRNKSWKHFSEVYNNSMRVRKVH